MKVIAATWKIALDSWGLRRLLTAHAIYPRHAVGVWITHLFVCTVDGRPNELRSNRIRQEAAT
jgi:hypothetical protein